MSCSLKTELYVDQKDKIWPTTGRHILAHYDDKTVVVYQAFCPDIANYVVNHGEFGGPKYSFTRMTWIKTNFMWMMYRSGWGQKPSQERTLAIHLSRAGFDQILKAAREGRVPLRGRMSDDVRLQWDPDHSPSGDKLERRAIQLGLRGDILKKFHEEWIQRVEDISDFVSEQKEVLDNKGIDKLMSPSERVYVPSDPEICAHIRLTGFEKTTDVYDEETACGKTDFAKMMDSLKSADGACCSELLTRTCQKMTVGEKETSSETAKTPLDVIVCLGGAFNPVHTRHIEVVNEAVNWVKENTKFKVIAARLAVAPDGYVKAKYKRNKQKCMKAEHRIQLCEIACKESEIIKPYMFPVGSALDCGEKVKRELGRKDAKIAVICGADRAVLKSGNAKWNKKANGITLCIGRKGTEMDEIKEAFVEDLKSGIVVNPDFYIIEKELGNVSSTDVRAALAGLEDLETPEARKDVVASIVEKGWITESVGNHILENIDSLYLKL